MSARGASQSHLPIRSRGYPPENKLTTAHERRHEDARAVSRRAAPPASLLPPPTQTRPVSAAADVVEKFGPATLDRVSAVAVQVEQIISSGSSEHLPALRRKYREQTRSLLATVEQALRTSPAGGSSSADSDSTTTSAAAPAAAVEKQLSLALHKATVAYYLSLHLHRGNYHHLALLSDYVLLVEVCCQFPDGAQQHADGQVLLDRCVDIVTPPFLERHPDQCKACAAQPIVASLLEDWGRLDAAGALFASHARAAADIHGALHPCTADAALQCAAFYARANAHGECLRQCRAALAIVVLHTGLWNCTAGQLNFHVGTQLLALGLHSQAGFFFQRAADVFEFVAQAAFEGRRGRGAGSSYGDVSGGGGVAGSNPARDAQTATLAARDDDGQQQQQKVDASVAGSALLWHALCNYQLCAVHREADNSFVALRHLREVRNTHHNCGMQPPRCMV
jgi:hypothetical protein